jgi:hypothetical protein
LSLVAAGNSKPVRVRSAGLALVVALTSACSFRDEERGGEETTANALRVTRDDGSTVEFPDRLRAWCGPYDVDNPAEAVWVLGGELPESDNPPPFWIFSRRVADLERSTTVDFPHRDGHATLFVLDPKLRYELSSIEENASGEAVVEEWGCEEGDVVRLRVDARLQSEIHDEESVTPVEGEVVAVIGDPVQIFPD